MVLLKALGQLLALFVLLILAFGGYYFYADRRAENAANAFCSSVAPGMALDAIAGKASAAGARFLSSAQSNTHKVFFQGPPFNGYFCALTVENGKVTSAKVEESRD
jgi:hypothetical protein